MTPGFTWWDRLEPIEGKALLIVNSLRGRVDEVVAAYREMDKLAGGALHIIAPIFWREWMAEHSSVVGDRLLFAADEQGRELELNYFLETSAFEWVSSKSFAVVIGTAPHSLYNDTVHAIFEHRVALLLRDGVFLAHALPERGVYLLDLPSMVERFGRDHKIQSYRRWCRALIDDLHREWTALGAPGAVDNDVTTPVVDAVLAKHLGPQMLAFDERGPIPFPHEESVAAPVADFIRHVHTLIHDRDVFLAALGRDSVRRPSAAEAAPANTRRTRLFDRLKRQF